MVEVLNGKQLIYSILMNLDQAGSTDSGVMPQQQKLIYER